MLLRAQAAETGLHRDINEHIITLHVEAKDFKGVTTEGDIPVTTFRPNGDGPFPLVVISHGRSGSKRAEMGRVRFESAARYFVRKGFAVAVPTRLGYSGTASLGDPESEGACRIARYDVAMQAASSQIAATVTRMQQERWVDKRRVLLVGLSVGGISTVGAAALGIPGVVAAVNFAGGHGGNPDQHPGVPCNDSALLKLYAGFGKVSTLPMLWVYTQNDKYFDAAHSKAWADAYNAAGGHAEYRLMGAFGDNGHQLFVAGNDIWQPVLDAWLTQFGFATPGALKAPPESGYAAIGEVAKLPYLDAQSIAAGYLKFLEARGEHRAFALNASGNWGWAFGADDVLSRAFANCQKASGKPCMLYAVDGAVVWRH
jgi:dienelactone hydrolase